MITEGTTQTYRASFSAAPCGHPYFEGEAHPGHVKCIKMRRRIEAGIRNRRSDVEKAARHRQQALADLAKKAANHEELRAQWLLSHSSTKTRP